MPEKFSTIIKQLSPYSFTCTIKLIPISKKKKKTNLKKKKEIVVPSQHK
jgi:hypothetical protein